jgi:hypothetical protein
MPSKDGDYCLIYLIVPPDQALRPEVLSFDVLMHIHHVFTDGSGIRSILNEFLARLAGPLASEEIFWGDEVERLLPASLLLAKDDEKEVANSGVTPAPPQRKIKRLFEVCVC